jgi:ribosomal protein S17E
MKPDGPVCLKRRINLIEVSIITGYVIDRYAQQKTSDFQAIFDIVEEAINAKDSQTRELTIIGFLTGILLIGSHRDIRPECFEQWIGKTSKTAT